MQHKPPSNHIPSGVDYVGHWIVDTIDFRFAALAAIVLVLVYALRRKRSRQEPSLADALNIAIGVISFWTALIIGAIFLLTNPVDVSALSPDTARMMGLIAVIVLVASGWTTISSGMK